MKLTKLFANIMVFALLLTACGGNQGAVPENPTTAPTQPTQPPLRKIQSE